LRIHINAGHIAVLLRKGIPKTAKVPMTSPSGEIGDVTMIHQKVQMAKRAILEMKQAQATDDLTYHLCAFLALLGSLEQFSRTGAQRKADRDKNAYYAAAIGLRNADVHAELVQPLRTIHIGLTETIGAPINPPATVTSTFKIKVPQDAAFMKGWAMKPSAIKLLADSDAVDICERALHFFVALA
jgi:hypothetical protein